MFLTRVRRMSFVYGDFNKVLFASDKLSFTNSHLKGTDGLIIGLPYVNFHHMANFGREPIIETVIMFYGKC